MTRWLDALGGFKWPSLLLIAAPLAAYPFWLPEPVPAENCGLVIVAGHTFRAYRSPDTNAVVLRASSETAVKAEVLDAYKSTGFDAGGMVVDDDFLQRAELTCTMHF